MKIECHEIGLVMNGAKVTQHTNWFGQTWWMAEAEIGSIFGSDVNGGISAIGPTREQALERLVEERKKLYDSIWY
jgi:hypothetical protein